MADRAHVETDKVLNELADKIRKVYKQAADEMQGTVKDYFESFKERDLAQKKLVEKGKLTERQYKLWRQAQIGRGERYKAMQAKLAQRMTDAKEVAISYINDRTAEVYSINHNYAAYTIENASNLADFTLFDEQTVKDLIVNEPALTPYYPAKKALKRGIDLQYGKEQITKHVTSGIMQGKSVTKIADELLKSMAMDSYAAAMRLARTTMGAAQNGGRQAAYDAAEMQGVVFKKQWIATHDFRTRYSHANIDNVIIANNAVFPNGCRFPNDPNGAPSEVYNCRCTMVALVDGANSSNRESYDEWLERKINEQGAEAIRKKFADKGNYKQINNNTELRKPVLQKPVIPDNINGERQMAMGMRRPASIPLSNDDKEYVIKAINEIEADINVFQFRDNYPTAYNTKTKNVYVSSQVFPSDDESKDIADRLSVRCVLAHEYYGHYQTDLTNNGQRFMVNGKLIRWADEFHASYTAAIKTPNLTDEERRDLMLHAKQIAENAGVIISMNNTMKEYIYGRYE